MLQEAEEEKVKHIEGKSIQPPMAESPVPLASTKQEQRKMLLSFVINN